MACVHAWYSGRMKKLTVAEFARMGGNARAAKMTAEQRSESARNAVKKRKWRKVKS
jgi:hypothetical protein